MLQMGQNHGPYCAAKTCSSRFSSPLIDEPSTDFLPIFCLDFLIKFIFIKCHSYRKNTISRQRVFYRLQVINWKFYFRASASSLPSKSVSHLLCSGKSVSCHKSLKRAVVRIYLKNTSSGLKTPPNIAKSGSI